MKKVFSWMNDGEEFTLPVIDENTDVKTYIDLQTIRAENEKELVNLKPDTPIPKNIKDIDGEWLAYYDILSKKNAFRIVHYILHKIDESITLDQISEKGIDFVTQLYSEMFPPVAKNKKKEKKKK
jgi:hypothetical protein